MTGIMLFGIIIGIMLLLFIPYMVAGKEKDFNKFMGNFRN